MAQISKRRVSRDVQERMDRFLWESIARVTQPIVVSDFISDIFTPTERVMIAKRLSIAILLLRGWDQEAISSYLKVSTTTVQSVKRVLSQHGNGYRKVISEIESDKEWQKIKLDLGQALEEILAGRVGANWKAEKSEVAKKYYKLRKQEDVL